jgi:hypothetical protein
VNDQGIALSMEERRRLLEANVAAARFFRRELLRATSSWAVDYLKSQGVDGVLSTESMWKVGYAPTGFSRLTDHLREQGFGYGTLVRAGLVEWTASGDAVDRHQDQLMLVARDQRLSPVGFVGIGPDGAARSVTGATMIHRPSNVLVGVEEQRDLLDRGAIPVIVDDPIEAIAISNASREFGGEWAGIPVCGSGLSTAQARTLRRFSTSDRVVVVLSGDEAARHQTAGYVLDLAMFFDRIRAIEFPSGVGPASILQLDSGPERLREVMSKTRPLMTYRVSGQGFLASQGIDPDPPEASPVR